MIEIRCDHTKLKFDRRKQARGGVFLPIPRNRNRMTKWWMSKLQKWKAAAASNRNYVQYLRTRCRKEVLQTAGGTSLVDSKPNKFSVPPSSTAETIVFVHQPALGKKDTGKGKRQRQLYLVQVNEEMHDILIHMLLHDGERH